MGVIGGKLAHIRDARIGCVNADHSVHGKALEEDEEDRGGRDGSPRLVNTLGAEMALSTADSHSVYLQYDNGCRSH